MSAAAIRRALHFAHLVASLLLLATGALMSFPDMRGRLLGGYGREIAGLHTWAAWAFMAAPALALALAPRWLWRDLVRRLGPPDGVTWRKANLCAALVFSILLGASGLLIWVDLALPNLVVDAALEVHIALSWALGVLIPCHLFMARRKIAQRFRELIGREPELPGGLPFEDESGAGH